VKRSLQVQRIFWAYRIKTKAECFCAFLFVAVLSSELVALGTADACRS